MAAAIVDVQTGMLEPDALDAERASRGDADAFERLYRRHSAHVYALARRMLGAEEDAADATQEVFVRTWRKLGLFRGESAFATWLHRLAVNVILARRTIAATRRDRFLDGVDTADYQAPVAARPDLRVDFEVAIEKLPEGARQVFVLYDVEGYRHEEIAALLGISVGTSKSQLHRARMTLRQFLV